MTGQGGPSMLKHTAPRPRSGLPGALGGQVLAGTDDLGAAGGELRVRDELRVGV